MRTTPESLHTLFIDLRILESLNRESMGISFMELREKYPTGLSSEELQRIDLAGLNSLEEFVVKNDFSNHIGYMKASTVQTIDSEKSDYERALQYLERTDGKP